MKSSVYDTILIAKANGNLAGRKAGNALDRRLKLFEAAVLGTSLTLVNAKLLNEYGSKILDFRNEAVRAFYVYAIDHGVNTGKSSLSRSDFERSRKARWPAHDQHLIAAAIGREKVSIYVTEVQHSACAAAVRKQFGITIVPS